MPTQEQIRAKRKKLDKEWEKLNFKEKELRLKYELLESQCTHPNMYQYSACGDPGSHCPDCGYDI